LGPWRRPRMPSPGCGIVGRMAIRLRFRPRTPRMPTSLPQGLAFLAKDARAQPQLAIPAKNANPTAWVWHSWGPGRARGRSSKSKPRHKHQYNMALRPSDHVLARCPHRMPTQNANCPSLGWHSVWLAPHRPAAVHRLLSTVHCPLPTGFPLTSPPLSAIMRSLGLRFGGPEDMLTQDQAAEIIRFLIAARRSQPGKQIQRGEASCPHLVSDWHR